MNRINRINEINKITITCKVCKGSGYEKRQSELCPCSFSKCYKCENNAGFIVKPYETCRMCDGSGRIISSRL